MRRPISTRHRLITNKHKVKLGLLGSSLWLLGFFLITGSLYSSIQQQQLHPKSQPNNRYHIEYINSSGIDSDMPRITIFAAPGPFSSDGLDSVWARQELAVQSWLSLTPNVGVVLFGRDPLIHRFASRFGSRVVVESGIDFTFLGTPFFHSMLARSQVSASGISLLIDPETILLPNVITTLQYAHRLNRDWFLISITPSISNFPFHLDESGKHWLLKDMKNIGIEKLQEFLVQKWSNCGKRLLMAWNTGDLPLHAGILPPFLYGKGLHNEWLVHEVVSSNFRIVIDSSLVASAFYLESLDPQFNKLSTNSGSQLNRNWEYEGNHYLASLYGSFYFQPNNASSSVKLIKCSGQYFLFNLAQSTLYSLKVEEKPSWLSSTRFLQFREQRKWIDCIEDIHSLNREGFCSEWYKISFKKVMPLNFSFSLKSLLQTIADEDKSVVLAVAGDNYRDMLMNWVCRLRHLAVTNFIICALDPDIYQFSVLQGLPVFKDPLAPNNISFNDCHFGTECFQRVTKVKSRIVLEILKLGYNVLMSDVDIYWFTNPLPFLHSFGPAAMLAQSDEYNETVVAINLPRRLNSGFYFVRSDPPTIAALKKVVKHASTSDLSEQPSFYDVLCGEGGTNRVGDDRCVEPDTNLTVLFLDRNLFPNGAYRGLWEKSNVRSACVKLGCVILHNNWINGRKRKFERQLQSGLWDYDPSSRMCIHSWQRTKS